LGCLKRSAMGKSGSQAEDQGAWICKFGGKRASETMKLINQKVRTVKKKKGARIGNIQERRNNAESRNYAEEKDGNAAVQKS